MKTLLTLLGLGVLVPAVVFAQVGVNTNVDASAATPVAQVSAGASASATVSTAVATKAKSRADQELDRRIAALNDLIARVGQMTRVTADFKTQLSTNIQTQIGALTTLKSKIDADTDAATLKSDVQSITQSYRVYMLAMPQARLAAAADRIVNIATMESALGAKLQARLASVPQGSDISALSAALGDLASTTTAAVGKAQAGVSATASLAPDNGDKTLAAKNNANLQEGRKDLQAAQQLVVAARKDITAIISGLAKLHANANASSSVQTQ